MTGFHFRPTEPDEAGRVREFLASVFRTGLSAPSLDPALIHWKYYEPRPDWVGGRSFVLERNAAIVAHGCVWPMRLGHIEASQIIDWAGARSSPGAGLLLRREIEKMVPVSVAIGGSEDSRNVLPRAGYKTAAQFRRFARVLHPVRQMRQRKRGAFWRNAAKTFRNALWQIQAFPSLPAGWSFQPVQAFSPADLPPQSIRPAELLNYFLRCPGAEVRGYRLLREKEPAGFFLISEVAGQARIADLHTADGWDAGVAAAVQAARQSKSASELVANSSYAPFSRALTEAGFIARGEQPVYVLDKSSALADRPVHITSADYDDFFGIYADDPFVT